jgi:hypothetical protein
VLEELSKRAAQPPTPLLNFLSLLIPTAERRAKELFEVLRSRYQGALSRDASFDQVLHSFQPH